jgi:hypothetical protein
MESYGSSPLINYILKYSHLISRIDRGRGDEVRSLVLGGHNYGTERWKEVKFMVFDLFPDEISSNWNYETRLRYLQSRFATMDTSRTVSMATNVVLVPVSKCRGYEDLCMEIAKIVEMASKVILFFSHLLKGRGRNHVENAKFQV